MGLARGSSRSYNLAVRVLEEVLDELKTQAATGARNDNHRVRCEMHRCNRSRRRSSISVRLTRQDEVKRDLQLLCSTGFTHLPDS